MIPRFRPQFSTGDLVASFFQNGNEVRHFEEKFGRYFGGDAIAFSHGRVALYAYLKSAGVTGREVIMPAYTCSVVAHAVRLSGNTPVFVDLDFEDYNMDLDSIREKIGPDTAAVIITHLFGYPADIDAIETVISEAEGSLGTKILRIHDCAHSFDAQFNGRSVSEFGDAAIFGLNVSKTMTSIYGGILLSHETGATKRLRAWRELELRRNPMRSARLFAFGAGVRLAFTSAGYSFTNWLATQTPFLKGITHAHHLDGQVSFPADWREEMSHFEAGIGLRQLRDFDAIKRERSRAAEIYRAGLPSDLLNGHPVRSGECLSHFVTLTERRTELLDKMRKMGVELGEVIQYVVPLTGPYHDVESAESFPNAESVSSKIVNWPIHSTRVAEMVVKKINQ